MLRLPMSVSGIGSNDPGTHGINAWKCSNDPGMRGNNAGICSNNDGMSDKNA